jgi:phosphohistidine phosphatase SixA
MHRQRPLTIASPPAPQVTRFVFVRHGHYDKASPDPKTASLLERGRAEARRAAEFLRECGVTPDLIVTTRAVRTRETAEVISETLGTNLCIRATDGGFARGKSNLDAKLQEWTEGAARQLVTVICVGHHVQQNYCLAELEGSVAIPKSARGSVLIYERGDQGRWRLTGHQVGGA